jgi:hypothetical protein
MVRCTALSRPTVPEKRTSALSQPVSAFLEWRLESARRVSGPQASA